VAICSISTILSFWSPSLPIADVKICDLILAMIMMICTGDDKSIVLYMLEEYQFTEGLKQEPPDHKHNEEGLFLP